MDKRTGLNNEPIASGEIKMQQSRRLTKEEIQDLRAWAEQRFGSTPPDPALLLASERERYIRQWLDGKGLVAPRSLSQELPRLRIPDSEQLPPAVTELESQWESGSGIRTAARGASSRPSERNGVESQVSPAPAARPPAPSARPAPSRVRADSARPKARRLSYHQRFMARLNAWSSAGGPATGPLTADGPDLPLPAGLSERPTAQETARTSSIYRFRSREQVAEERRQRREQRIKELQEQRDLRVTNLHQLLPRLEEIRTEQQQLGFAMIRALLNRTATPGRTQDLEAHGRALSAERNELLDHYKIEPEAFEVDWDCPACQNTGWLPPKQVEPAVQGEPERYFPPEKCDCLKREELADLFKAAGLQGPQQSWTFDSFSLDVYPQDRRPAVRSIVERCLEFAAGVVEGTQYQSLVLAGPPGVGKTHLACAVAHDVIDARKSVVYLTMTDFLEMARIRTLELTEENRGYLYQILNAHLLVLDDLGAEKITEYSIQELTMMLNHRLNNGLPLLVTTNLTADELQDRYGDRIYSRLVNGCEVRVFIGGVDVRSVVRDDTLS